MTHGDRGERRSSQPRDTALTLPAPRTLNLLILSFTVLLLGIALYMQHGMGLQPCYLCITQRVMFIAVAVITLAAVLHNPNTVGRRAYGGLTLAAALGGAGFAVRQLWLQSLPPERVPACGPPADYLFDAFPLRDALAMLLQGDGSCAEVDWSLLGLSLAGWALLAFAAIAVAAGIQLFRVSQNRDTDPR